MELYVNNNGELLKNNQRTIETGNRAYLYGDGLFETIRVLSGEPINYKVHIERLLDGMRVLRMRIPAFYTVDFFKERFNELIAKSAIQKGGKIRLSVDRMKGGTFRPETNEPTFFIEIYPLENNFFELNGRGWEVDLYSKIPKEKNVFSNYKVKNRLLNVIASIDATEVNLDDYLLVNSKNEILEGTGSNVFVVRNGVLYTPGLEDGCLGGTMRMMIINLALENRLRVYESAITPQNLFMADEVFLTNAISGIIWVGGFRTKRFNNSIARELLFLLNKQYTKEQDLD